MLDFGIRKIQDKFNGISTNYYYLAGPPGLGNLLLSKLLLVHASSLGLNTIVTLVPSE